MLSFSVLTNQKINTNITDFYDKTYPTGVDTQDITFYGHSKSNNR